MTTAQEARQEALRLNQQRDVIDAELTNLAATLRDNNVTMTTPLVDAEGFPLASIDIVAVRSARARIIALRNDRHTVEQTMASLLDRALQRSAPTTNGQHVSPSSMENHATLLQTDDVLNATTSASSAPVDVMAMAHVPGTAGALSMGVPIRLDSDAAQWAQVGGLQPFARVDTVDARGPAHQAGLRPDDELLRFGPLDASTVHRSPARRDLLQLTTVVTEGSPLELLVVRSGTVSLDGGDAVSSNRGARQIKRLHLVPHGGWGGRGLLGCHLLPL